MTNTVSDNVH